jgi:hypothetical protein
MNYLLYKNNQQSGPFEIAEIQARVAKGELVGSDLVWKEGMVEWMPIGRVIPPPPPKPPSLVPGMPPIPTTTAAATILVTQGDPMAGSIFLMASLDGSSKNHWDIINVETGKVVMCIRQAVSGFGSAMIKSGLLDAWGGGGLSKFHIALLDPSGGAHMVVRGGGIGGHSEVYHPNGEKIGEIKRTSMMNLNFEAFTAEGVIFKILAKGFGKLTSEQKIVSKDGTHFGAIYDSGWSDAKKILGDRIRLLDSDRMLSSKYTYKHKIELKKTLSVKEKTFLFGAVFQMAHVAG